MPQFLDRAEINDLRNCLPPLARQKTEVGAAGQNFSRGHSMPKFKRPGERSWRVKRAVGIDKRRRGLSRDGRQRVLEPGRVGVERIRLQRQRIEDGLNDGRIAGAAAEIAGESVMDQRQLGRTTFGGIGVGRHDETGRTESALRTTTAGVGELHRVQLAARSKTFDRANAKAVDLTEHHQTSIDCTPLDPAVFELFQDDRARAAIALGAALLGSGQPKAFAQPVEQRRCRRDARGVNRPAINNDAGIVRHYVSILEKLIPSVQR